MNASVTLFRCRLGSSIISGRLGSAEASSVDRLFLKNSLPLCSFEVLSSCRNAFWPWLLLGSLELLVFFSGSADGCTMDWWPAPVTVAQCCRITWVRIAFRTRRDVILPGARSASLMNLNRSIRAAGYTTLGVGSIWIGAWFEVWCTYPYSVIRTL